MLHYDSKRGSLKERFVILVTSVTEQKEQVKLKCWAGWASEDKMRDELHMKENFEFNWDIGVIQNSVAKKAIIYYT